MDDKSYLEKLRAAISDCFPPEYRGFLLWIVGATSTRGPDDPSNLIVEAVFDTDSLPPYDFDELANRIAADYMTPHGTTAKFEGRFDSRGLTLILRCLAKKPK